MVILLESGDPESPWTNRPLISGDNPWTCGLSTEHMLWGWAPPVIDSRERHMKGKITGSSMPTEALKYLFKGWHDTLGQVVQRALGCTHPEIDMDRQQASRSYINRTRKSLLDDTWNITSSKDHGSTSHRTFSAEAVSTESVPSLALA